MSAKRKLYIRHRVNTLEAAAALEPDFGAEIDLRSDRDGRIYLHHDPFADGPSFDEWLALYSRQARAAPLILNTKEDGLEAKAAELCASRGVSNYFFLDTAFPTLVKWSLLGTERRFAVRVSAHEPSASALRFRGHAAWVWVDCFGGVPLKAADLALLAGAFKICLVSPEMQGADPGRIVDFAELFAVADAICSKRPDLWMACHGG